MGIKGLEVLSGEVVYIVGDNPPETHATSHKDGGTDEILLNELGEPTAALDMGGYQINNLATPTGNKDAINLEYLLNSLGVSLNYWLEASNVMQTLYMGTPAFVTNVSSGQGTEVELTSIYWASSLVQTPAPFVIKNGAEFLVHFNAKVSTNHYGASYKTVKLFAKLYHTNSAGADLVQIGAKTSYSVLSLTETPVLQELYGVVTSEVSVPADRRLLVKMFCFVATSGAPNYPTVNVEYGDVHDHFVVPLTGSVFGNFLPLAGGTMNGDIAMGGTQQVTGLQAPDTNGDAIRATAKITEALLESATDLKHTQGTDTALGALSTKNPPIDADKIIYRNSESSDVLVTMTFTQLKAFLKTYFDTLYQSASFTFTITTVTTPDTFTLPIYDGGTYNFVVVWGDTGSDAITAWDDAAKTHTYATPGTYQIVITGTCSGWRFNNAGDCALMKNISQWGSLSLGNSNGYFYGCSNLTISAIDPIPAVASMTFQYAFRACTSLTSIPSNIFSLNISVAASGFNGAFYGCTSLTEIPSGLFDNNDLVSTSGFGSTFGGCTSLETIPSGLFDNNILVSTNGFQGTFSGCTSLTEIPSGLFDNNTAVSTTGFYETFYNCTSLTTVPDGLFDNHILNTSFSLTFQNCAITTLDATTWSIVSVTNMTNMFNGVTLTTPSYDALLIAWEAQVEQPNVIFHAGSSVMTLGGAAEDARDALVANGWTITDSTGVHT